MSDTRHTAHASQGKARLRQSFLERPETVVHLPGGETMVLKRDPKSAPMPLFRKLDPKKFDPRSGRPKKSSGSNAKDKLGAGGKGAAGGGMPAMMPFSKMVITALLAHQVYGFLKLNLPRWWRLLRGAPPPAPGALGRGQAGAGTVVVQGAWGPEEVDETDLDQEGRLKLAAARKAQAAMARAMVRNAMPKPQHQGLPQRMAQAHGARQGQGQGRSAKQRMRPSSEVKARSKGKLEKMEDAIKREVKAAVQAARQQQQQQQQPLMLAAAPRKLPPVLEEGPSPQPAT